MDLVVEKGVAGARTFNRKNFKHIHLSPGESRAILVTLPTRPGSYLWEIEITSQRYPHIRFQDVAELIVGEFPDSLHPNILKASFTDLQVPSEVRAGDTFFIQAYVKNTGDTIWLARPRGDDYRGVVLPGIRKWYDRKYNPCLLYTSDAADE